jgi:hypothetical protein
LVAAEHLRWNWANADNPAMRLAEPAEEDPMSPMPPKGPSHKKRNALIIIAVLVLVLGSASLVIKHKYDVWAAEPDQVYARHVKAHADVGDNSTKTLVAGGQFVCTAFFQGKTERDVDASMAFEDVPDDLAAATKLYAVRDLCPQYLPKLKKQS